MLKSRRPGPDSFTWKNVIVRHWQNHQLIMIVLLNLPNLFPLLGLCLLYGIGVKEKHGHSSNFQKCCIFVFMTTLFGCWCNVVFDNVFTELARYARFETLQSTTLFQHQCKVTLYYYFGLNGRRPAIIACEQQRRRLACASTHSG